MKLSEEWEKNARDWAQWARTPGHDPYLAFSLPQMMRLVPPPGRCTLDLGCGEGRLARDLKAGGHKVVGVDASPTLIHMAAEADADGEYHVGDAARLPFGDNTFDLVVALNSLIDMDDLQGVTLEVGRVLKRGGRFCIGIVHPLNSAGEFAKGEGPTVFNIRESYLAERFYSDTFERSGLRMTFHSIHRPLEAYANALEEAGFLIEAIREPAWPSANDSTSPESTWWGRIPIFLFIRAVSR